MRLPLEIASTVRRFVLEEAVATRCPFAICNKVANVMVSIDVQIF
jgi:hypothetical protein